MNVIHAMIRNCGHEIKIYCDITVKSYNHKGMLGLQNLYSNKSHFEPLVHTFVCPCADSRLTFASLVRTCLTLVIMLCWISKQYRPNWCHCRPNWGRLFVALGGHWRNRRHAFDTYVTTSHRFLVHKRKVKSHALLW